MIRTPQQLDAMVKNMRDETGVRVQTLFDEHGISANDPRKKFKAVSGMTL